MATTNRTSKTKAKPFTIGLAGFAKISTLEVSLSLTESRRMIAEFERKGMSAAAAQSRCGKSRQEVLAARECGH